eukprot:3444380-Pleurochrysis_carterae.AAC.3
MFRVGEVNKSLVWVGCARVGDERCIVWALAARAAAAGARRRFIACTHACAPTRILSSLGPRPSTAE